jgi:hypothetical protein
MSLCRLGNMMFVWFLQFACWVQCVSGISVFCGGLVFCWGLLLGGFGCVAIGGRRVFGCSGVSAFFGVWVRGLFYAGCCLGVCCGCQVIRWRLFQPSLFMVRLRVPGRVLTPAESWKYSPTAVRLGAMIRARPSCSLMFR